MKQLRVRFEKRSHLAIGYALVVAAFLLYLVLSARGKTIIYDTKLYVLLAQSFNRSNLFTFNNYFDSLRGYFFPYLLYFIAVVPERMGFELTQAYAFFTGLFFAGTVFLMGRFLFRERAKRLLCFAGLLLLTLVFWEDYFTYPLSDLYSFMFLALAACGGTLALELAGHGKRLVPGALAFVMGILLFACYNTRPVYILGSGALLLVFLFFALQQLRAKALLFLLPIGMGALLAAVPQVIINYRLYAGVISAATGLTGYEGSTSLLFFQLQEGLTLQRYDTTIGAGVRFVDPVTAPLVGDLQIVDVSSYLSFVLRYPFETIGLYARHFVNLMSPYFRQCLILDLQAPKWPFLLLNYAIWYTAIADVALKVKNHVLRWGSLLQKGMLFTLPLLLVALVTIPLAVEGRFAIPLVIPLYLYLMYKVDYRMLWQNMKKHWFTYALVFAVAFCILISVWSGSLATVHLNEESFPLLM